MSEETKKTPQAEPAAEPKTAEQAAPEAAAEQAAPASETAEPKDAKKDGWFKKNRDLEAAKAKLEAAEQGRLAGAPAYTLEDSRKRLEEIYRRG